MVDFINISNFIDIMFNASIYRSYDIRGIVPTELDKEECYHIGRAYAKFTGAKRVVVARDMRPSGDEFEPELVRGLTEGGVNVIRIGLATSPMFYFAVHFFGADGGVMVTASHNPGQYNGLKMTRAEAVPIAGDSGLMDIRDLAEKRDWEAVTQAGKTEDKQIKDEYVQMVTAGFSAEGLKIVVDAGNGMSGYILKDVFERLGGEVVPLYWELDGSFPNHEADPLKEENLEDLKKVMKQEKADLGVAFDGDADRVFFVTDQGETVPGDITTAIIAKEVLAKHKGAPVLYDIRASWTPPDVIKEAGGEPVMWKVGHSLIKAKMREVGAKFAGEVSGHFFFTPWFAESGMLAMGHVLTVVRREGKSLSEIVKPLLRYVKTPEINYDVPDKEAAIARIKNQYSDASRIFDFDGIRFEYEDWWASVRPSNTEPKLRLNMEAKTSELLEKKKAEIEGLIKGDGK